MTIYHCFPLVVYFHTVFDVEVGAVENEPPESLIDSSSPSPSQLLPLLTLVSLLAILSLTCY